MLDPSESDSTARVDPLDWISPGASLAGGPSSTIAWPAEEIARRVGLLARRLRAGLPEGAVVASLADNSPAWLVADLALHAAGMVHVPLPAFFTPGQRDHSIRSSNAAALFCDSPQAAAAAGFTVPIVHDEPLSCFASAHATDARLRDDERTRPAKITFTSGTTGTPKGVILTFDQQFATARGLATATASLGITRHLCLLPLPVLLENVAGAYTALLSGARCCCPGLSEIGMTGASGFDARRCLDLLTIEQPDSVILLPQMLHALVVVLEADHAARTSLGSLKFMAVGGARTPVALIHRARSLGLPVYEGYGLSECASVVSLNLPGADQPGSVGRPLPGVRIRLAADGEVEVDGRGFSGYLGSPGASPGKWLATGDLGTLDKTGHLTLVGRKKNILVTSYGRNVSPEWPEGLLAEHPGILQCAVFGDARPWLVAVVVAAAPVPDTAIDAQVAAINARLPDYARIGAWLRADEPFTPANGLATANGRARRDAVHDRYARAIASLYAEASPEDPPDRRAPAHH